jgi:hypothetical protein
MINPAKPEIKAARPRTYTTLWDTIFTFLATHYDNAVARKADPFSKASAGVDIIDDGVTKIRLRSSMIAYKFKSRRPVDQNHDLSANGQKWQIWMGPEASFAGQSDMGFGRSRKRCGNLCACGFNLASGAIYLPAKGSKTVSIKPLSQFDMQAQETQGQRCDDLFLAVHRGEHRALTAVRGASNPHHQKQPCCLVIWLISMSVSGVRSERAATSNAPQPGNQTRLLI